MKTLKKLGLFLIVSVIMLANSFPAFAMDFKAEEVYESVFVIYSGNSLGSGFAIGENCVVTNAHVITDEKNIQIKTYSGDEHVAYLIKKDDTLDIALLGVEDIEFKPLKTAKIETVNIGDDVFAIGAPNSLAYTLTKGVVSAKERKVGDQSYIQTDAAINSGNSGGPLLDNEGRVIGVNSYKMSDSEGIGLAITIDTVIDYISGLKISVDENGNVKGAVEKPGNDDKDNNDNKDNNESKTVGKKSSNFIDSIGIKNFLIYIVCGLSVALNIFFIIYFIYQKKKNRYVKIDPSERTDFDIDILE